MENSRNKRGFEYGREDVDHVPGSKKQKLPALARYINPLSFFIYIVEWLSTTTCFFFLYAEPFLGRKCR